MTNKTKQIKDIVSPEQIEQWKREHKKVFRYMSADGKVAYFKNVSLQILDAARSQARVDQSKFKVFLINNTYLGGDKELIEKEEYLLGLFDWLEHQLVKIEGVLEEL